jgi:CHAD domain-containing protein
MNFIDSLSHQQVSGAGSEIGRQVKLWLELLRNCAEKPSRKRIHILRVTTLRIQSGIEHELGTAKLELPAIKRWNRQAEKLRSLISTVRETDVYLGKLDELRDSVAGPEFGQSRLARICLRQIDAVEERMKQDRKSAARKASDEIKNRLKRLDRLSRELESELVERSEDSGTERLREMLEALVRQSSQLNAKNMHEFRKQVKKVRYAAEIACAGDPSAARQLALLRRMQSAAGVWRDWETLARRVGRALHAREKKGGLAELLDTMADESLEKALEICRRTAKRLSNENSDGAASMKIGAPKRPVRSVESIAAPGEERFA